MKFRFTKNAILTIGLALATRVSADNFVFSETFSNAFIIKVTGSFSGTASGNIISDISNVTVSYWDSQFDTLPTETVSLGTLNAYGESYTTHTWSSGSAVVSIDGTANNFLFSAAEIPTTIPYPAFLYSLSKNTAPLDNNMFYGWNAIPFGYNQDSTPQNWSVTNVSEVPLSPAIMMFATGFVGIAVSHRKLNVKFPKRLVRHDT